MDELESVALYLFLEFRCYPDATLREVIQRLQGKLDKYRLGEIHDEVN